MLAAHREIVFRAPFLLDLSCVSKQQARLSDEIERDVRQSKVFLERWRVAYPFAQPLAQHEARVGETQNVVQVCGVAHRFFTSSGIA